MAKARGRGINQYVLPFFVLLVGLLGALLAADNLQRVLPVSDWPAALTTPLSGSIEELLFVFAALPRLAVAFLCGTALSLSGLLFQQSLRNGLAEPTTLGTSAGAQTTLLLALVFAPGLLDVGQAPIAIAGAAIATAAVFAISAGAGRSPISIILAGLVVNLTLGTICAIIVLLYPERSEDLAQWQTGRLEQTSWGPAFGLMFCLLLAWAIAALFCRALRLLEMDDTVVTSLGMKPAWHAQGRREPCRARAARPPAAPTPVAARLCRRQCQTHRAPTGGQPHPPHAARAPPRAVPAAACAAASPAR